MWLLWPVPDLALYFWYVWDVSTKQSTIEYQCYMNHFFLHMCLWRNRILNQQTVTSWQANVFLNLWFSWLAQNRSQGLWARPPSWALRILGGRWHIGQKKSLRAAGGPRHRQKWAIGIGELNRIYRHKGCLVIWSIRHLQPNWSDLTKPVIYFPHELTSDLLQKMMPCLKQPVGSVCLPRGFFGYLSDFMATSRQAMLVRMFFDLL